MSMKKQVIFVLVTGLLLSCHKDHNDPSIGTVYNETSPTPGGMKINLLNNTQLMITGNPEINGESLPTNTTAYQIVQIDTSEFLLKINSPSASEPDTINLWFASVDSNRYEVSTCEPGLPCPMEISYFFEKE
jgi:hypothetical protein